jgi:hypothetical protein
MTDPRTFLLDEDRAREVATYLWQEYQYRHDLVWQLTFRVTAVATLLLIAPDPPVDDGQTLTQLHLRS